MKRIALTVVAGSLVLAGCSTASKDIAATYVSPMQYNTYDCDQIVQENARLTSKVGQLGGRLDEAASNDKAITGVGVILFWPALFALGGTKQQEAEYAKLRGEHDALQQAAILKKCSLASPPALEAKKLEPAQPAQEPQQAQQPQPAPAPVLAAAPVVASAEPAVATPSAAAAEPAVASKP
ncbi:MAG: hypothetical protein ACN6O3_19650 [Comamonas sp.]